MFPILADDMINFLKRLYRFVSPKYQTLFLEYKVDSKPRYGNGKPPHPLLYDIISKHNAQYKSVLKSFLKYKNNILSIKDAKDETDENNPTWNNGYLPGLDIIALYGMVAESKPRTYLEIGSGNSTKVVRKAIAENNLNTKIISIDPNPRTSINQLCDEIIRQPLETLKDLKFIIDLLNENDILFIDNSHRIFPNSDSMICFMEILPFLKKGVIVHFHDIYLPYDYPQFMCDRFYNEQYMLAAFTMSNPDKYKPILPNFYISETSELASILSEIWEHPNTKNVERHGGSYWLQIN